MPESHILALNEEIYDAGAGGTPFRRGRRAQCPGQGQLRVDHGGRFRLWTAEILYHAEIPDDAALAYRGHYKVDLWTNRAIRLVSRPAAEKRARVLVSGDMMVPDHELLRSEFHCDFGRRLGVQVRGGDGGAPGLGGG